MRFRRQSPVGARDVLGHRQAKELRQDAVDELSHEIVRRLVARGRRGLTVAGVSDGVGASSTAMALAWALARRQVATLIIDTDLQRPTTNAPPAAHHDRPGLAEVLRGEIGLIDALDVGDGSGPTVLRAGSPRGESEARIFSKGLSEILEHGLRRFQMTIVDSPPANRSTVSFHVARTTGYSLLVARRNVSFAQDLSLFADQMRQVGAEVVGSVLTG